MSTNNLFRLTVRAVLDMDNEDRLVIGELIAALTWANQPPANEHNPTARQLLGQARFDYLKAKGVAAADQQMQVAHAAHKASMDAKRTRAANKAKTPLKVGPGGSKSPGNNLHNKQGKNGIGARVRDVLTQATGGLSSKDIAEYLDTEGVKTNAAKVAASLSYMWGDKTKGLTRTIHKSPGGRPEYLWVLEGK